MLVFPAFVQIKKEKYHHFPWTTYSNFELFFLEKLLEGVKSSNLSSQHNATEAQQ